MREPLKTPSAGGGGFGGQGRTYRRPATRRDDAKWYPWLGVGGRMAGGWWGDGGRLAGTWREVGGELERGRDVRDRTWDCKSSDPRPSAWEVGRKRTQVLCGLAYLQTRRRLHCRVVYLWLHAGVTTRGHNENKKNKRCCCFMLFMFSMFLLLSALETVD